MLIYWVMFAVLAIGALLNRSADQPRGWLALVVMAAIPIALMIGLRWQIGPDWPGYLDIFKYTSLYSLGQSLGHADPGFFGLMWLLHGVTAPFWVLNFICGTVFIAGLTAFALRQPNPWLAFLVAFPYLVIVVGMSGDRQSMAMGFLFFALNAFERERLFRFTALTLIAATFHASAILLLPFGLLSHSRNSLQTALLLLIAVWLGYHLSNDEFSVYARRYGSEKVQSSGVAYRLAMNGLAAVLFLIFRRRFAFDEHQDKLWRNMSLATLLLIPALVVVPSSTAIDRFLLYLFPLQFVILSRLPTVLARDRQATGQNTLAVIGYAALVQIVFLGFGQFAQAYIPYRSIFSA